MDDLERDLNLEVGVGVICRCQENLNTELCGREE